MHNKTYNVSVFLIAIILLQNFGIRANPSNSHFDAHKDMVDMFQEKVTAQTGEYSVPRNQILLEIATGTW